MRNFRKLDIWKKAIELTKLIYKITVDFPITEKYGLKSQIQRASVSVASNIAEGSSRRSEVDFARFLEMSIGSAFEVETQLIIAKELGYISKSNYESILSHIQILQRQINALLTKIRQG
jgi:four helix bundle protein|tara:strand:+ start:218 stop:574 length:357 start_codon:yes stop_codon:yes gene_type:complete